MTWQHLVTEAIQKENPGIAVDYVNTAVPGFIVKSSLLNFRRWVASLKPGVTIIYHATNDLSWETRTLAEKAGNIIAAKKTRTAGWVSIRSYGPCW